MATIFKKSWADDDSSVDGSAASGPAIADVAGDTASSTDSSKGFRFKIAYTKHMSTYARVLFDVEGHVLRDEEGSPLNIFRSKMKDMLADKRVTCFHVPGRPGYRYFVVSQKQADDFRRAKRRGYMPSSLPYHVYPDEPGSILPHEPDGARTAY
jgi:hypothetical protein